MSEEVLPENLPPENDSSEITYVRDDSHRVEILANMNVPVIEPSQAKDGVIEFAFNSPSQILDINRWLTDSLRSVAVIGGVLHVSFANEYVYDSALNTYTLLEQLLDGIKDGTLSLVAVSRTSTGSIVYTLDLVQYAGKNAGVSCFFATPLFDKNAEQTKHISVSIDAVEITKSLALKASGVLS